MRDLIKLLHQLKPFAVRIVLGMLLALVMLVSAIGLLSLSGWFISATAFAGLMGVAAAFNYFVPAAGVRFFALLRIVARYLERLVSHDTTFRVLEHLRVWVYQHLAPLSGQFIAQQRRGDLLNRMVSDVDALDNLYLRILSPVVVALVMTGLLWFFLQWFSVLIANLVLAILLLSIVVIPPLFAWLGHCASAGLIDAMKQLRTNTVEGVQGLAELKLFQRSAEHRDQFMQANQGLLQQQYYLSQIAGFTQASMLLLLGFTVWMSLYFGIELVNQGQLGGAHLALIVLGVLASFEAIMPLPAAFQYLGQCMRAAKRINVITQQQPEVVFAELDAKSLQDASVAFQAIDFAYAAQGGPVFKDFSLRVKSAERIGIVGPSGAGKSTLIQLLTRMVQPQSGQMLLGGIPIEQLTETQLRSSMSVMEQSAHFFNDTIRENLCIAKQGATDIECWSALKSVQLDTFVNSLPEGIDTFIGEAGARLSGGQLRRLALARVVLHDAPVWLLDEPTEGLDYRTEQAVVAQILALSEGKTVLWISHKPAGLSALDRVIKL